MKQEQQRAVLSRGEVVDLAVLCVNVVTPNC
jgi:hypothetical protein